MNVEETPKGIIIKSFLSDATGNKGPSEVCGKIKPGDILISVQGISLKNYPFREVVDLLKAAPNPIKLGFSRTSPLSVKQFD